jgi:serine/threonine protein kinase
MLVNQYYLQNFLGAGGLGTVWEAKNLLNGEMYALKSIYPGMIPREIFLAEVAAYQNLSHYPDCSRYAVCLFGWGYHDPSSPIDEEVFVAAQSLDLENVRPYDTRTYYLVTELMDGDLGGLIEEIYEDGMKVNPAVIVFIILQCLRGLEFIHERNLAHGDIKPANILYKMSSAMESNEDLERCLQDLHCATTNLSIKYGDFGVACADRERAAGTRLRPCETGGGTSWYWSPEYSNMHYSRSRYLDLKTSQGVDMWAMGITLWEILFGAKPFGLDAIRNEGLIRATIQGLKQSQVDRFIDSHPFPLTYSPQVEERLRNLLRGLLQVNPLTRLTAGEAKDLIKSPIVFGTE